MFLALGYKRYLKFSDYRARYERGGLAPRVIDEYAVGTWRNGAELIENDNPDVNTEFETAFDELCDRLQMWPVLTRADQLASMGRYAGLLLGLPGDLEQPPTGVNGPESLMYVQPYSEEELTVDAVENDSTNRRFGLPTRYRLNRKSTFTSGSINKSVHWQRIIHIASGVLDDNICGTPSLERVWNHFDDLEKVTGGGAEAFWQRVHPGLFFNIDPETILEPKDTQELKEESEKFVDGMKRTMAIRGTTVTHIKADVSDFGPQVNSLVSLIAGSTGIPQRILLGSERGQLASSQDQDTWIKRVADRRSNFAEGIVRLIVERFQLLGILTAAKFKIRWPDLEDLNATARGNLGEQMSKVNKNIGATVVTAEEIRDKVFRMPKLTGSHPKEDAAAAAGNTPSRPGGPKKKSSPNAQPTSFTPPS